MAYISQSESFNEILWFIIQNDWHNNYVNEQWYSTPALDSDPSKDNRFRPVQIWESLGIWGWVGSGYCIEQATFVCSWPATINKYSWWWTHPIWSMPKSLGFPPFWLPNGLFCKYNKRWVNLGAGGMSHWGIFMKDEKPKYFVMDHTSCTYSISTGRLRNIHLIFPGQQGNMSGPRGKRQ